MTTNRLETILAQARRLSPAELAQLIKRAADLLAQSTQNHVQATPRYASLFGSGNGTFPSAAEADRFLREERDAWDE
jgi:hypothetical protein